MWSRCHSSMGIHLFSRWQCWTPLRTHCCWSHRQEYVASDSSYTSYCTVIFHQFYTCRMSFLKLCYCLKLLLSVYLHLLMLPLCQSPVIHRNMTNCIRDPFLNSAAFVFDPRVIQSVSVQRCVMATWCVCHYNFRNRIFVLMSLVLKRLSKYVRKY